MTQDPISASLAPLEVCWAAGGRLHVLFDGQAFADRSRVQVIADGDDVYDLTAEVRTVGGQLIRNGDFGAGMDHWSLVDGPTADLGRDLAPEWTLSGGHTAYVRDVDAASQEATLEYLGEEGDGLIPVVGGRRYHLSLFLAVHRCTAEVTLEFLDTELATLHRASRRLNAGRPGGQDIRAYDQVALRASSPKDASWARLRIRKSPTSGSAMDSYLFLADVTFGWSGAEALDPIAIRAAYAAMARWGSPRVMSFTLPAALADGSEHELTVIDPDADHIVAGSPLMTEPVAAFDGGVEEISGSLLRGWARDRQEPGTPAEVSIEVDGAEITRVIADHSHAAGAHGFDVVIPAPLLDGKGHHVLVRALPGGFVIGQTVRRFPRVITPWGALQEHASDPLPSDLAPAAAYRYRSMQQDLEAAGEADDAMRVRLPQLGRAHEIMLRGFERNRAFEPLTFPTHEDPVVSVVVPVHNKRAVTYTCLAALLFAHNKTPFEVIVVDDASIDETVDLPGIVEGVTFIRSEQNRGFVHTCNDGAKRARGRYIVFLNNDTEPTAGWIDEMVLVFRNFADVGLVGSQLLYPDGRLQEAGGVVWSSGDPWNYGRGHNPHRPEFGYTRQADYVSGASLMIGRETWDEVGGFSEEYAPAYFEDTDLAFKVRAAGKKTVFAPLSVVFHHEGLSNGTDAGSGGLKRYQEINRPKFRAKWAGELLEQPEMGLEPRLAVGHRGAPSRALFVDHATPQPDRSAGAYAEIQEMRLVQSLGYQVSFFPENLAWMGADTEYLQRMGVEVIAAPFFFNLTELLEQRGTEYDLVYVTRFDTALRAIEPVRRLAPQAKIALTLADLHFLRQIRDAISGAGEMETALGTRDQELRAIGEADVVLTYSDVEQAVILSHDLGAGNVALAPWVADVEEHVRGPQEREGLAFLGSYAHPPNRQAVEYFCEQVMPRLRKEGLGIAFHVYGSAWPEAVRKQFEADDVVFEGFADSIDDAFGRCRIAVAPLVSGAGLKGKVIDALTHGLPQVLSTVAVEGTGLRHGLEAFVAETPDEWVACIKELAGDDARWQAMSDAARTYARAVYSFERNRTIMREALHSAGAPAVLTDGGLFTIDARPDWTVGSDR